MATVTHARGWKVDPGQRFVLEGVSWSFYEHLLRELNDRHIRVTYDRGVIELMSPSERHERCAELLGQMVVAMTLTLRVPRVSGGSTTFRKEELEKGLEPDHCYWLAHAPVVQAKPEIDLEIDPPPDLAIEIDITSSSANRMGIYAALGVPEVWRYDGDRLDVFVLDDQGEYRSSPTSRSFPMVPMKVVSEFLERGLTMDETEWLLEYLDWFSDHVRP